MSISKPKPENGVTPLGLAVAALDPQSPRTNSIELNVARMSKWRRQYRRSCSVAVMRSFTE